jgi:hypothetical protein
LDIFQNIFSDEFKTVMSNFKTPMSRRSYKKIQENQQLFEFGEPKDNRIKMVKFYFTQ